MMLYMSGDDRDGKHLNCNDAFYKTINVNNIIKLNKQNDSIALSLAMV
jgi:hypothetical protein